MSSVKAHKEIGARLFQLRGSMTQAQFAERLGVASKTIGRWEAGEAVPDGPSLLALLTHFHADPSWVLLGTGSSPPLRAEEQSLLDNYRAASAEGRKVLAATSIALAQSVRDVKKAS